MRYMCYTIAHGRRPVQCWIKKDNKIFDLSGPKNWIIQYPYQWFSGDSFVGKEYRLSFFQFFHHLPFAEELDDVVVMLLKMCNE